MSRKKLRNVSSGVGPSNFALKGLGQKFWDALPWQPVDVANANLGDYDDSVFLGLEEIDGNAFLAMKEGKQPVSELASDKMPSEDAAESQVKQKRQKKRSIEQIVEDQADGSNDVGITEDVQPEKKAKRKKKQAVELEESQPTEVMEVEQEEEEPSIKSSKSKKSKKLSKTKTGNKSSETQEAVVLDLSRSEMWGGSVRLNSLLVQSLRQLEFVKPTPIQTSAIPAVLSGPTFPDIVGVAETGSGKTLAFGIPILHTLLSEWEFYAQRVHPMALIISPTRELALQIHTVLRELVAPWKTQHRLAVRIAAVVGGLAEVKQRRVLSRGVHVVVATVGRLGELLRTDEDSCAALQDLSGLRYLVVDEADRIMDDGHFSELHILFSRIHDHEGILRRGETVAAVRAARRDGIPEAEHDARLVEGLDDVEEASLGPSADEVQALIERARAEHGAELEQAYDSDDADGDDAEDADNADDDEDGDDDDNDDGDDQDEQEADSDPQDSDGDADDASDRQRGRDCPAAELVPLPPRQTLLFTATGMLSLTNMSASARRQFELQQRAAKLKLHGTVNGVPSHAALPLKLKELLSTVARMPVIRVIMPAAQPVAPQTKDQAASKTAAAVPVQTQTLPPQLLHREVRSPQEDKDAYLYALCLQLQQQQNTLPPQQPRRLRVLVFANAIKTCRRLDSLLRQLGLQSRPLHSQLTQKQRLQHLEVFQREEDPQQLAPSLHLLVATEVAARGLDIADLTLVVHYDVARSVQSYIHRAGRTARLGREGTSLSLVSPADYPAHVDIVRSLRSHVPGAKETQFPAHALPLLWLPLLRQRIATAKTLFTLKATLMHSEKSKAWTQQQRRALTSSSTSEEQEDEGEDDGVREKTQAYSLEEDDEDDGVDEEVPEEVRGAARRDMQGRVRQLQLDLAALLAQALPVRATAATVAPASASPNTPATASGRKSGKKARKDISTLNAGMSKQQRHVLSLKAQHSWKKRGRGDTFFTYNPSAM